MWHYYLIGYAFAIICSLLIIRLVVDTMWEELRIKWKQDIRPYEWHARAVGVVDSALYVTSWLLGVPEFIAVWLAFKVAGLWIKWQGDTRNNVGRAIYNIFIIGNGLSIAYATSGAMIIKWLHDSRPMEIYLFPLSLIMGTLCLWWWACSHVKNAMKDKNRDIVK
jgi:hypothetical protein